jgi:hypothetical protein
MQRKKKLNIISSNYKEKLENVISTKIFSENVKNLLLSLIYKIEDSYSDYLMVKGNVDDLENIIKEIIDIVSGIEQIEIISPHSNVMKRFEKNNLKYEVDKKNRKIKTIQSEVALLGALYDSVYDRNLYIPEQYDIVRESFPYILNEGRKMGKIEIIRDFDGWAWNNIISEMERIDSNIIYQNIIMLLGKDFFDELMLSELDVNLMDKLKTKLEQCFDKEIADEFIEKLFEISIIIFCKENDEQRRKFRFELLSIKDELRRIRVKKQLDEEINQNIVEYNEKIEELTKILNDSKKFEEELLKNEIIDKNEIMQIMTPESLERNLNKKIRIYRKKVKSEIELLDKEKYKKYKEKLEKRRDALSIIEEDEKYYERLIEFQIIFLNGIKNIIMNTNNKEELIGYFYMIRYYNFIPFSNEKYIKDVQELKNELSDIEEVIIEKFRENKMIAKFSNNTKFDDKIIKRIFKMRVIDLDKIAIEFRKEDKVKIIIYDEETIEKGFAVNYNSEIKINKYDKKIWLFT